MFRNFEGIFRNFVSDYVFQFALVVKTYKFYEFFYDNSFIFGSTGFDPKFVASFAAR